MNRHAGFLSALLVAGLLGAFATGDALAAGGAKARKPVDPNPALTAAVAQLAADPTDDVTRTQVIDLAHAAKTPPAVSPEAKDRESMADDLLAGAKSPDDYRAAAKLYAAAIALAPWLGRLYYDEGLALEKAADGKAAAQAYNWYLLADPAAANAAEVGAKVEKLRFAAAAPPVPPEAAKAKAAIDAAMAILTGPFKERFCGIAAGPAFSNCNEREAQDDNWHTAVLPGTNLVEICQFERRGDNDIRRVCSGDPAATESGRLAYDAARDKVLFQVKDANGEWRSVWTELTPDRLSITTDRGPDDPYDPTRTYDRVRFVRP